MTCNCRAANAALPPPVPVPGQVVAGGPGSDSSTFEVAVPDPTQSGLQPGAPMQCAMGGASQISQQTPAQHSGNGGGKNGGKGNDPAPVTGKQHDGFGVFRNIASESELQRDSDVRGRLKPPVGKPPKGVQVETREDGTRVVSLNIHGGASPGSSPGIGNANIRNLRDVARYVNGIDADVVMMQEVNSVRNSPGGRGVGDVVSTLAHLMNATDSAFTPGQILSGHRGKGVATFTRNGYTIGSAANVNLPQKGDPNDRSAGFMTIIPPDGGEAFTAVNAHLSHGGRQKTRGTQLQEIQRVLRQLEKDGSFTYTGMDGKQHQATGFASDRIILGGDLNTTRNGRGPDDAADPILGAVHLRHANALANSNFGRAHIDHLYGHGFNVTRAGVAAVQRVESNGAPTDHKSFVADFY